MKNDSNSRKITEKIVMPSAIDINACNQLQKRFSAVSHLFTFAYSAQGNQLTEMSGKKEQAEWIKKNIGMHRMYSAFQRASESVLEDMIIEDTQFENVKIGAIVIRIHGKVAMCWIVVGCISNYQSAGMGFGILDGIDMKTTYSDMLKSMDLLQFISKELTEAKNQIAAAELEADSVRNTEEKLKKTVERSEMTAKVVQFLERTDAMEHVLVDLITILGQHLGLQSTHVFRLEGNRKMEVICEWYRKGVTPYFEQKEHIERLSFLRGEKATVISFDTKLNVADRAAMDICGATGIVSIPIKVKKIPDLYVVFVSDDPRVIWSSEDVKFLADAVKIMQSTMIRKIQKNSLAVSYSSLDAILDNAGAAILVEDHESSTVLFANKVTKAWFPKELQEGRVSEILSGKHEAAEGRYEVYESNHNQWLDLIKTKITWVDGRLVTLYTAYDITEKKEYQRKIELQAQTDYLTGLYNRMSCMERLGQYVERVHRMERVQGAVIFVDMDNFKEVNDTLGHDIGDVLLKSVSRAFKSVKGLEDHAFRMGGDEFVFLISPEQFARKDEILKDLQEIFDQAWHLKEIEYHCSMSMGVAFFPENGCDVQELLTKADAAMYRAKKTGKNQMAIYQAGDEQLLEAKEKEKNRLDAKMS